MSTNYMGCLQHVPLMTTGHYREWTPKAKKALSKLGAVNHLTPQVDSIYEDNEFWYIFECSRWVSDQPTMMTISIKRKTDDDVVFRQGGFWNKEELMEMFAEGK